MGMSIHIEALIPPTDPEFQKMLAVRQSCLDADVPLPKKVADYFGKAELDRDGNAIIGIRSDKCCRHYATNSSEGYEVDIRELPEGTRYIRFYNSY